jgi:hypothetical protein
MSSPTQRTLKYLRDQGYLAQVVEKTVPRVFTKIDLFGAIDIVAIHPEKWGVLGIQCTTASNQAARLTKALAIDAIKVWVQAGNEFVVHGWRKGGAAGKRKLWTVNTRKVTLADFNGDVPAAVV